MKLKVELNYITVSITIMSFIFLGIIFFSNFQYTGQISICPDGYDFKLSTLGCAQELSHIEMTGYVAKSMVQEEKPKPPHVERSPHPCSTNEECEQYGTGFICEKVNGNEHGFCELII